MILSELEQGDKYLFGQQKNYEKALESFSRANALGEKSQSLTYKKALANFELKNYDKAHRCFQKVIGFDTISEFKAYYYLGRTNQLKYQFDTAIVFYEEYRRSLSPDELNLQDKEIKKKIQECNSAKEMMKTVSPAFLDIMDAAINTQYVEYSPIASMNDSILLFTRRSSNNVGTQRDQDGEYMEDIYFSRRDSLGNWGPAKNIGKPINTSSHDAAAGISADGTQLIIYRSSGNGDLYQSNFADNKWSNPKRLNKFINTSAHEASASFSYDKTTLYFSSDRPGGYGGHDIYQSKIDENSQWVLPEILPAKINTPFDEVSMIALPDGKTFYFTSNGHNSMGGLDIFKITYKDSAWSEPINLGYPINTPNDDMLLSISADEKFAYVAISKSDSNLHDIYLLTLMQQSKPLIDKMDGTILAVHKRGVILPQIEKAVNIEAMDLTVLKGAISDQFTGDPIFANIELTDNATNQVVATFNSNETTGNYLVSLPSGKDYGIAVKAENCLFYSDNLTISNAKGYNEIVKDIQLQRIEVGSKVVLKNIFFATGKATLTESSETELQNLLKLMRDVPSLKIEVSGHTDNVGSASKNKVLSEDRAKAVVDYLLANNIAQDRLIYKGYGFEQPIASNQTKEGRQQNRRTEFKVIAR
jgi:outer membrane protein OmpA-like peptidoglycan-associated protein/tetratricopeptide (TPR) repeat protein